MRISDAESRIMAVLWDRGPTRAEDLIPEVCGAQGWGEGTVRTLINRLRAKKAIVSRKEAGRAVYHALVARADYVRAESQGLLDKLFEGRLAPFIAHFSDRQDLSDDEIAELRALIERLDRGK